MASQREGLRFSQHLAPLGTPKTHVKSIPWERPRHRGELPTDVCPLSSRGSSNRNVGSSRTMRNHFSVLFTAARDIFSFRKHHKEDVSHGHGERGGPPGGIARVGVHELGAVPQDIKASPGCQKWCLAAPVSESRAAAGAGTASGTWGECPWAAGTSGEQSHHQMAPLCVCVDQEHFQIRGCWAQGTHTVASSSHEVTNEPHGLMELGKRTCLQCLGRATGHLAS